MKDSQHPTVRNNTSDRDDMADAQAYENIESESQAIHTIERQ
jgi:hypothetical protein